MQKEVLFVLFSATFHSGDRVSVVIESSNTQKGQAGRESSWERQQEERGEEAKVSLASGLTVACQACSGMDKHKSQSLWDEKGPCVTLTRMHKECLP